jgi:pimeloyl-ACP methyl ester carboxylesterase
VAISTSDFAPRRPSIRLSIVEAVALTKPTPKIDLGNQAAKVQKGDGRTVLVMPPLGRGDACTIVVREFLTRIGYDAHGWNLGVNPGPTARILNGVADRLQELFDVRGAVSLLGFSMGGIFGRWLALRKPEQVRQVITVRSPIHEPARSFWLPLGPLIGFWRGHDLNKLAEEIARPLPVPRTILFSREDGIVNWLSCVDRSCPEDCFEIAGPHTLIAHNPRVMSIVADRLARSDVC